MAPHPAAQARPSRLRVVSDDDPKAELTFLFAQEAALQRQLAGIRADLETARRRYAGTRSDGESQVPPRMELLRTRFGPQMEPRR